MFKRKVQAPHKHCSKTRKYLMLLAQLLFRTLILFIYFTLINVKASKVWELVMRPWRAFGSQISSMPRLSTFPLLILYYVHTVGSKGLKQTLTLMKQNLKIVQE